MNNELFYIEPADNESIADMADRLLENDLPEEDHVRDYIEDNAENDDTVIGDDQSIADIMDDYFDNIDMSEELCDNSIFDVDNNGIDDSFDTFDPVDLTFMAD